MDQGSVMAHRDEGWRWVACVGWDRSTRLGSGSGLASVIEHDLVNTFVRLESQVKGLAEHATVQGSPGSGERLRAHRRWPKTAN